MNKAVPRWVPRGKVAYMLGGRSALTGNLGGESWFSDVRRIQHTDVRRTIHFEEASQLVLPIRYSRISAEVSPLRLTKDEGPKEAMWTGGFHDLVENDLMVSRLKEIQWVLATLDRFLDPRAMCERRMESNKTSDPLVFGDGEHPSSEERARIVSRRRQGSECTIHGQLPRPRQRICTS